MLKSSPGSDLIGLATTTDSICLNPVESKADKSRSTIHASPDQSLSVALDLQTKVIFKMSAHSLVFIVKIRANPSKIVKLKKLADIVFHVKH
jgi:hypothetical protein